MVGEALRLPHVVVKSMKVALAGAALGLAICLASGSLSLRISLAVLCAAMLSSWLLCMLLEANRQAYEGKKMRLGLVDYLYLVLYHKLRGGSYLAGMRTSLAGVENENLRQSVATTLRRYLMDAGMQSGEGLSASVISGGAGKVADELRKQRLRSGSRWTEIEEGAQRYATFSMFVSTVLPSFLVFAFIGNSVLARGDSGLLLFSCILLLLVPVLYSLGSVLMWRRLLV